MLSRRDLVGRLAAGVAGAATLAVSGKQAAAKVSSQPIQGQPADGSELPPERMVNAIETGAGTLQGEAQAQPAQTTKPAPPWALLAPLAHGAPVADGWKIADLTGPADGACVLTLENESGRVQRIHLCRNDGQPRGLVYTRRLDLVVMNGGRGDLDTDETFAQAVAAVAHAVAANERRADHATVIATLMPHEERLRRFSAENEWTLR